MATKRMLIDASHPEETRVLILNRDRLEDFDVEFESRRPLKGNIYLAKVTRVEPSLQAAFVDFGGNRHGFLAFNEIHPDYYQIPVADREALIAEARAEAEATQTDEYEEADPEDRNVVETLGGDDIEDIEARRPAKLRRHYKIQEVIKRRQILLVQVVKEERGTKGAALSTFLSLAGRYCVLMPNTDRGGGISRKIGNASDRKRLKSVVNELGISEGMAIIVRTAGGNRSKAEIRRDYDYLLRLWNKVREMTLNSIAPCLVHEEGNLIKRTIRDLYTKEIDEIIVHGEDGYRMAKDFMKILMPSHAKKVQKYKTEGIAMTRGYNIEEQLATLHSPEVHMNSGAYIVINPTEALVSIDVNSGRSTKERNIEETALRTNIEAAEEIARQLRLRDLAGLIVIDFIDMEVHRNHVKVERALKDAMRPDRARIQIGRISPFGLLELSRQRLRPSLIETSSEPCPYCAGTGNRRSTDTTALEVIRAIEEEGMRQPNGGINVFAPTSVSLFVLNNKRQSLMDIEKKYGLSVAFESDDTLIPPAIRIERDGERDATENTKRVDSIAEDTSEEPNGKKRRRRRGRRKGRRDEQESGSDTEIEAETSGDPQNLDVTANEDNNENSEPVFEETEEKDLGRRRRRGRRGGRRRRKHDGEEIDNTADDAGGSNQSNSVKPLSQEVSEKSELIGPEVSSVNLLQNQGSAEPDSGEKDVISKAKSRTQRSRNKPVGPIDKEKVIDSPDTLINRDGNAERPSRQRRKSVSDKASDIVDSNIKTRNRQRRPRNYKSSKLAGTHSTKEDLNLAKTANDDTKLLEVEKTNETIAVSQTDKVNSNLAPKRSETVNPKSLENDGSISEDKKDRDPDVIIVGEQSSDTKNRRRGWWQRT